MDAGLNPGVTAGYVIFGDTDGFGSPSNASMVNGQNAVTLEGECGGRSGASLGGGDFNGDGIDDIIVGARNSHVGE